MSNKLSKTLLTTATFFLSQQAFSHTCFMEPPTSSGPTEPATCVNIEVINKDNAHVNLAVSAVRMVRDISNSFSWN